MKKKIRFYPKSHRYKIGKKELISVTTFVGTLFEKFDAKAVARKLAKFPVNKYNKRGVRYWLKEWKEAANHGTRVHQSIENQLNNKPTVCETDSDALKTAGAIEWFNDLYGTLTEPELTTELIVGNEEYGIAGTIDLMINEDGSITLVDWKTNKKIASKGYQGKVGIHPLTEGLADCHLSKYTLQLSIYAYLLELEGYHVKDLFLVHLKDYYVETIKVDYKKELVKKLLEMKKNGEETN